MADAEQPERLHRPVTVDDVRQLMGSSTPHFSLQIRDRIARLEALAFTGEVRGEGFQDGQRSLPSLDDREVPRYVEGPTAG